MKQSLCQALPQVIYEISWFNPATSGNRYFYLTQLQLMNMNVLGNLPKVIQQGAAQPDLNPESSTSKSVLLATSRSVLSISHQNYV